MQNKNKETNEHICKTVENKQNNNSKGTTIQIQGNTKTNKKTANIKGETIQKQWRTVKMKGNSYKQKKHNNKIKGGTINVDGNM